MLNHSYNVSDGFCLNNFLHVMLIGNKRQQVPPFRYINQADEISHLVWVTKLLVDTKYLMGPVKRAAEAVGIWTEDNWNVKRVDSLYNMLSGRIHFKRNKMFDPLSW